MTTTELAEKSLPLRHQGWGGRLHRVPWLPVIIIGVTALAAILADYVSPHSPIDVNLRERLLPPFWMPEGSTLHLLGTDQLGRDLLSRMIYGTRISLLVAVSSLAIGGGVGVVIGLISAYAGGWVDTVLMRVTDALLAIPIIFTALLFATILGANLGTIVAAIAIGIWARYARVIRGEALSLKERDFVAYARVSGGASWYIMFRHLFPNVVATFLVLISLQVGWVIIVEATLSFLGAGVPPPTPAWGSMVASGRGYLLTAWWISLIPGVAIAIVVMSFNLFGDWLRDTLDPKLRQV